MVVLLKQKTAYELLRSLVGSEMCIRDRGYALLISSLSFGVWHIFSASNISVSAVVGGLSLIHI